MKFDLQAGTQAAQGLTQAQVQDLVSNCLKLASENKITTKVSKSLAHPLLLLLPRASSFAL